eukprot:1161295-Pelagomonas_calceolata.AAC.8
MRTACCLLCSSMLEFCTVRIRICCGVHRSERQGKRAASMSAAHIEAYASNRIATPYQLCCFFLLFCAVCFALVRPCCAELPGQVGGAMHSSCMQQQER